MTDDGVHCALEYNCVRWAGYDLPPPGPQGAPFSLWTFVPPAG